MFPRTLKSVRRVIIARKFHVGKKFFFEQAPSCTVVVLVASSCRRLRKLGSCALPHLSFLDTTFMKADYRVLTKPDDTYHIHLKPI